MSESGAEVLDDGGGKYISSGICAGDAIRIRLAYVFLVKLYKCALYMDTWLQDETNLGHVIADWLDGPMPAG